MGCSNHGSMLTQVSFSTSAIKPQPTAQFPQIDFIFFLDVNKETIIKRIEKRKVEEKRGDDDLDTILKRYDTYLKTTSPVLDYYSSKQNFYKLDGNQEIDQINKQIKGFLKL